MNEVTNVIYGYGNGLFFDGINRASDGVKSPFVKKFMLCTQINTVINVIKSIEVGLNNEAFSKIYDFKKTCYTFFCASYLINYLNESSYADTTIVKSLMWIDNRTSKFLKAIFVVANIALLYFPQQRVYAGSLLTQLLISHLGQNSQYVHTANNYIRTAFLARGVLGGQTACVAMAAFILMSTVCRFIHNRRFSIYDPKLHGINHISKEKIKEVLSNKQDIRVDKKHIWIKPRKIDESKQEVREQLLNEFIKIRGHIVTKFEKAYNNHVHPLQAIPQFHQVRSSAGLPEAWNNGSTCAFFIELLKVWGIGGFSSSYFFDGAKLFKQDEAKSFFANVNFNCVDPVSIIGENVTEPVNPVSIIGENVTEPANPVLIKEKNITESISGYSVQSILDAAVLWMQLNDARQLFIDELNSDKSLDLKNCSDEEVAKLFLLNMGVLNCQAKELARKSTVSLPKMSLLPQNGAAFLPQNRAAKESF